ncbi:MAG: urease accessory UreF family protein [Opitutales bacterium]
MITMIMVQSIPTSMTSSITTEASGKAGDSFDWLASLLQTSDTLFPSGGYAHSYGLEELVAMGQVTDAAELEVFLREDVLPTLERLELPYLRFCHEAALRQDLDALFDLNEEIGAWKLSREVREASLAQGRQLIRMIDQVLNVEFARTFALEAAERDMSCHQITACAILRTSQGTPIQPSLVAWVYQSVSTFCSAAIKLLRLGEVACQRIIRACLETHDLRQLVVRSLSVEHEEAGWFNPLLDIASARHETAFSRLFIS